MMPFGLLAILAHRIREQTPHRVRVKSSNAGIVRHLKGTEAALPKNYYFMRLYGLRPEGPGGNSHDRQVVDREPIKTREHRRCGTKR